MTKIQIMTPKQSAIVERILALRRLTKETGSATTRTINKILQALDEDDLLVVSVELNKRDWK